MVRKSALMTTLMTTGMTQIAKTGIKKRKVRTGTMTMDCEQVNEIDIHTLLSLSYKVYNSNKIIQTILFIHRLLWGFGVLGFNIF